MKVEELMIGDYVKFLGRVRKIKSIIKKDTGVEISFEGENPVVVSLDEIEPIPLTPEILEKNGFKKDKETDQWYFESNYRLDMGILAVDIDDGCGVGICVMPNKAITYYCKYVHELQHFLRLIGGAKELCM